ncbi:MAG: FAD-dependent oxidoreductase [Chloroflexota bacterium]|nr:FAD-dependent oxidoreductase [Chloroflexota bacterium]
MKTYDVVIVGAGIIGLMIARAVRNAGLSVALLERSEVGKEASWASAGVLMSRPYPYESIADFSLRVEGSEMLLALAPVLVEETGIDIEAVRHPALHLALTADDESNMRALQPQLEGANLGCEFIAPGEVRKRQPEVTLPVRLGMVTSCANIENRRLLRALDVGARKAGVDVITGCDVQGLQVEEGKVTGVRTANQEYSAGTVVNATGSWGGTLRGAPEHIPVQPERGQMLSLRADSVALTHLINLPQFIIIPRKSGRIVLGATSEKVGYDRRNTAGAIQGMLQAAIQAIPALAEGSIEELWSGFRPFSPDGYPLVGPSALPGYFYAVGHYKLGIQQAPITAEIIRDLVTTGRTSRSISHWDPTRFEGYRD